MIFPSKDNRRFDNVKKSWTAILGQAQISQFRWHDMRHHFARMTLIYAHLAPEHKANAVAKLVQGATNLFKCSIQT